MINKKSLLTEHDSNYRKLERNIDKPNRYKDKLVSPYSQKYDNSIFPFQRNTHTK